ncbi:MAG: hypothetical protein ACK5JS_03955 [Mangrovibacterium sp.]
MKPTDTSQDLDAVHGRIETRRCSVIEDLSMLIDHADNPWCGLKSIVKVDSERINKTTGEISLETRYCISTLNDAEFINNAV